MSKKAFLKYHKANPQIYVLFRKFAIEVRNAGFTKYSSWAIVQRIRWHEDVETKCSTGFKINNNLIGWYSRFLVYKEPRLFKGFFRHRQITSKDKK